jgi:starch phosphorylase
VPTRLEPFANRTKTAYFTMEIAIRPEMHTYSGGLGILAGDTARSCADLQLPLVFVTLASRAGYFRQSFDADGRQLEDADWWQPDELCTPLDAMIAIEIEERPVWIRPWLHILESPHGHQIPVLLLDTDLDQNAPEDRSITHYLYGDGETYRLKQEIVLGIGGSRLLRALGFEIDLYHMNEGHAALLTLDLLNRRHHPSDGRPLERSETHVDAVRDQCVFTTHTPVEAGHDKFRYELFEQFLPSFFPQEELRQLAGPDRLNMTRLALNLSGYINGVAHRHAETTERMFPGYRIRAVTNGVHLGTWVNDCFAKLYDAAIPHWRHEPELMVRALQLADDDIWHCHKQAKNALFEHIRTSSGVALDPDRMTIGFARRMTSYKRPLLLFQDLDRLRAIAAKRPVQLVMAGKAHPNDNDGKEAIRQLHDTAKSLRDEIDIVFLPNYEMGLAQLLVAGVDLWLNTPLPPMEASGTSGMKAAMNGVLNLSTLDGWWIEGCIEGATGWSIGSEGDSDGTHAQALLDKLETAVLPLYYEDPARWRWMMKRSIAYIASCFNSQRMMRRYASEAYFR